MTDNNRDDPAFQRAYTASIEAFAWSLLHSKLVKVAPATPLREVFPAEILGRTSANPATPVGDIFPLDVIVQSTNDACGKATELVGGLDPPSAARLSDCWRLKRADGDFNTRYNELLFGMFAAHASMRGITMTNKNHRDQPNRQARRRARAARARGWHWENFSEAELATLHITEVIEFLKVAVTLKWDELTPGEQRLALLARRRYVNWVRDGSPGAPKI